LALADAALHVLLWRRNGGSKQAEALLGHGEMGLGEFAHAERDTMEIRDEVPENHDIRLVPPALAEPVEILLIDPMAVMYMFGTEMDYQVDKFSAQFVFNNPNQTSACGCGESVELQPVDKARYAGSDA